MLQPVGLFRTTHIHVALAFYFPIVARILQKLLKIDGSMGWIVTMANATALLLPLNPIGKVLALMQQGKLQAGFACTVQELASCCSLRFLMAGNIPEQPGSSSGHIHG